MYKNKNEAKHNSSDKNIWNMNQQNNVFGRFSIVEYEYV